MPSVPTQFSDFIRVELDGKILDKKYYTVKEGSTIVTLKADYAATLSTGEHTVGIVSESGTALCTFTVAEDRPAETDTQTPQAQNSRSALLWVVVILVCAAVIAAAVIYIKRKNKDEE